MLWCQKLFTQENAEDFYILNFHNGKFIPCLRLLSTLLIFFQMLYSAIQLTFRIKLFPILGFSTLQYLVCTSFITWDLSIMWPNIFCNLLLHLLDFLIIEYVCEYIAIKIKMQWRLTQRNLLHATGCIVSWESELRRVGNP